MIEERAPLAREGVPFYGGAAFLALLSAFNQAAFLTILFTLATFFFLYFFRDPERSFTTQPGAVISPADGRIVFLAPVAVEGKDSGERWKLSIFMSPFDVHVNRAPVDGTVTDMEYIPGRYIAADRDAASRENERNAVWLRMEDGRTVVMTQVAGFLARRIVCRARPGDRLTRGERFGLIRMGSRVDLLLPRDFVPSVTLGDRVKAGQTTLGILP